MVLANSLPSQGALPKMNCGESCQQLGKVESPKVSPAIQTLSIYHSCLINLSDVGVFSRFNA